MTNAVAFLLQTAKRFEVVVQPLNDVLERARIHVAEGVPPLFEIGEDAEFVVPGCVLDAVQSVKKVVVRLPTNIAVSVQLLAEFVGRRETIFVGAVHGESALCPVVS